MTTVDLQQFPADIYKTLIALPYRVGLFISESDKSGGAESDARELSALENVVTFFVEDTLKSDFAQDIMLATLQHKTFWKEWGADISRVPDECRDVSLYLADHVDKRKLASFKGNLIEIAMAVAMAYREVSEPMSFTDRLKFFCGLRKDNRIAEGNAYLNISPSEKTAINLLAEIFGMAQRVE